MIGNIWQYDNVATSFGNLTTKAHCLAIHSLVTYFGDIIRLDTKFGNRILLPTNNSNITVQP